MKTSFTRWLPAIAQTPTRKAALAAAGFAAVCGGIAGPLAASHGATPQTPSARGAAQLEAAATPARTGQDTTGQSAKAATSGQQAPETGSATQRNAGSVGAASPAAKQPAAQQSDGKQPAAKQPAAKKPTAKQPAGKQPGAKQSDGKKPTSSGKSAPAKPAAPTPSQPAEKQLNYQFQLQVNYYYCGPAATRIAVSAHGHTLSQDDIANQLGTTVNGTNSAVDTTRVLNKIDGTSAYHTTSIPGKSANSGQVAKFESDVEHAIGAGNAVVANVAGTASDTLGGAHSYAGGHYVAVVGYRDHGQSVLVADPADTVADGSYWVHASDMANWMATRGYSS